MAKVSIGVRVVNWKKGPKGPKRPQAWPAAIELWEPEEPEEPLMARRSPPVQRRAKVAFNDAFVEDRGVMDVWWTGRTAGGFNGTLVPVPVQCSDVMRCTDAEGVGGAMMDGYM